MSRRHLEFGPRVRAWAVTAGGASGHPDSPHFNNQAERYAKGDLRPVHFSADDLKGPSSSLSRLCRSTSTPG
ncbi:penicillin acylase family protein [Streptomyces sp. NBC_00009]|uniref:penicillin acylase family protein n=1 Tax=Streptomyces sp. NBC_00009 TaxID=2975620 RepID=UPI0038650D16